MSDLIYFSLVLNAVDPTLKPPSIAGPLQPEGGILGPDRGASSTVRVNTETNLPKAPWSPNGEQLANLTPLPQSLT